jgi:hypothetical protein
MNDNNSTELSQPTAPGMHYTACCTPVLRCCVNCKHSVFNDDATDCRIDKIDAVHQYATSYMENECPFFD